MNIYQKINAVMKEVEYVKKDSRIQNYMAVSHDQVVSMARKSLVNHGIVLSISCMRGQFFDRETIDSKVSKLRMYCGDYRVKLINMDEPSDYVEINIQAHSLDGGDKAPGKCITYATKTALLKLLLLETGEDDESRAELRETINQDQATELKNLINGNSDLSLRIKKAYNIDEIEDLTLNKFEEIKERIITFNGAHTTINESI